MEGVDLSLVEAELRAAEAYLTSAEASRDEQTRTPLAASDRPFFKRPAKARPAISEDRRKEILAKLSTDRQAAILGSARRRQSSRLDDDFCVAAKIEEHAGINESKLGDRLWRQGEEETDMLNRSQCYGRTDESPSGDMGDELDEGYGEDEDDGEVFYASDVIGRPAGEDIRPRTALDLFAASGSDPDHVYAQDDDAPEFATTQPTNYRQTQDSLTQEENTNLPARSVLSKVFGRRDGWYNDADVYISKLLNHNDPMPAYPKASSQDLAGHEMHYEFYRDQSRSSEELAVVRSKTDEQKLVSTVDEGTSTRDLAPAHSQTLERSSRIDRLAQPRTHVFAEREKQRLVREMEELKECTFRPALLTRHKYLHVDEAIEHSSRQRKLEKSVQFSIRRRSAGNAFPWLTLSPRHRKRSDTSRPQRSQGLIDRLNLDVTSKYEARERLRRMLEAEKMRECTFQPKINTLSKILLKQTDYRPIHERVDDIQREKNEYIQRMREELACEDGAHTFMPRINPRSREIADAVLSERHTSKIHANPSELSHHNENMIHSTLRPPKVTDRLVLDAEELAEKRIAVQEYYDALDEKPFAPKISKMSNRLIEQRPEFKLDFLSRQNYFQMVEQEKLEALEDYVLQEQQITFRPNIGNADKVLREMRPDLANESSHQRLHRLIYHEPRRSELYRQRLREEANKELTFKPEINSVSKALAEKAKAEVAKRATRRHELQRYFAGKQFRSRVAKEMEQAEKAECTFRPKLISRSKPKSSSASKLLVKERQQNGKSLWRSDNILHMIEFQRQQRAEELQAKRNVLELKELEQCTFQPNVQRTRRCGQGDSENCEETPVVVRGLGRFLELRDKAKRQQEEQRQREVKAFNPNYTYEPRSYTVPKPFKLSQSSKDSIQRRLKAREELRSRERNECTFTPQTLESQQRKVLRRLLQE